MRRRPPMRERRRMPRLSRGAVLQGLPFMCVCAADTGTTCRVVVDVSRVRSVRVCEAARIGVARSPVAREVDVARARRA